MKQEITDKVKAVASQVLQDERILNGDNFNFEDADNLDSVNRVAIITELEDFFDVIFKIKEISSWNTVNELAEIIDKHLS